jgi:hypothetical protein
MKKTIELIISPTGETRLETQGYSGAECLAASQFLETALGRRLSEQKTSAFHQVDTANQNRIHEKS